MTQEKWLPDDNMNDEPAFTEEDLKMAQAMRKVANYLGRTELLAWNADTIADQVINRLKIHNV